MKRVLSLVLCLLFILSFVGCGKNNETTTTTTIPTTYYSEDIYGGYVTEYYSEYFYSDANQESINQGETQNQNNSGSNSVTNSVNNSVTDSASVGNVNSGTVTNSSINNQPNTTVKANNNTQTNNSQSSNTQTTARQQSTTAASTTLVPNIENLSGVQKATYNAPERTYIIYYPTDLLNKNSTYPILSWANGTACPPSLYDALLQKIALGGFIVIASDETMAADGTAQIAAIDFVIGENSNNSSALFKKVNTSKIGVIGHSQGGRSSVNAGASDARISCVLSIAGSNYVEEAQKLSKPVLFFAGTKDKVVDANRWIVTAYNAVGGVAVYASLNGAIHTTCSTNPDAYSDYAINWFNAWFYNNANAKAMFKDDGALASDSNWSGFMCKGF